MLLYSTMHQCVLLRTKIQSLRRAYHCDSDYSRSSAISSTHIHTHIKYTVHYSRSSILIEIAFFFFLLYFTHVRYPITSARTASYRLKHRAATISLNVVKNKLFNSPLLLVKILEKFYKKNAF